MTAGKGHRYSLGKSQVAIMPNGGLDTLLAVENKRTYFIKLSCCTPFSFGIQSIYYESHFEDNKYIIDTSTFEQEISNRFILDTLTVEGKETKYLKWTNNVKLSIRSDDDNINTQLLELHYEYIIDHKTRPKKEKPKPSEEETNEVAKKRWIQVQTTLCNKIWSEVRESFQDIDFNILSEREQLAVYQQKYPAFNRQHPLILMYMIRFRTYKAKAFDRYINKVAETKMGDKDAFLCRQADYVCLLWKECNNNWGQKESKKVWEEAYLLIKADSDNYKESQDKAQELAELVGGKYDHELRVELKSQIDELRSKDDYRKDIYISNREALVNKRIRGEYSDSDEDEPDFTYLTDTTNHKQKS